MIHLLQLCGQLPLQPDLPVGLNPLTLESYIKPLGNVKSSHDPKQFPCARKETNCM
jgi:hypothetical protein